MVVTPARNPKDGGELSELREEHFVCCGHQASLLGRYDDPTAGPQHAPRLLDHGFGILRLREDVAEDDDVHGIVPQHKALRRAVHE